VRRPRRIRALLAALVPVALALALWAVLPLSSGAQSAGDLQQRIDGKRSTEQKLSADAATFGRIAARLERAIAIIERKRAAVQAQLDANQRKLERIKTDLLRERRRLARLKQRLAFSRKVLSRRLREMYVAGKPDLVTVVLNSRGFADLLERGEFLRRIRDQDEQIIQAVRRARDASRRATKLLARLKRRQQRVTDAIRKQRDALASMGELLASRQADAERVRSARLAALHNVRGSRKRLEKELSRLQGEQNQAMSHVGPGGPWAIPWAIVQCESGGYNHPPNWAGASGYYQIIPSTWSGFGGNGSAAYLASKAEQDRVATLIWNNGRGASNWDCAYIVGILSGPIRGGR
jgi:peptidoglycan hydrolase CwlO-like protein